MEDKVWSISEVNNAVKQVIEGALSTFWIEGEIGTLTVHRSGHVYMVLKDSVSQIKAVYWKGAQIVNSLKIETGVKVEAFGQVTVYEPRGEYQFSIKSLRLVGIGTLQQKFDEIKLRLFREGLFDQERKKNIPLLPRKIGVITSPSSAAIQDFLNIINRRFPNVNIKIYPAAVQGAGAEKQVIKGLKFFNACKDKVDVIVLTRGGGSMEDLWPFNDETLAREIAASKIPTISAIGHEIDFTICDFVSDLRVPTPSAAAELVIGKQDELSNFISVTMNRMHKSMLLHLEQKKRRIDRCINSFIFKEPKRIVFDRQQKIDELLTRMKHAAFIYREQKDSKIKNLTSKLSVISPSSVLGRGYSILTDKASGDIITSDKYSSGTKIEAILSKGKLNLTVD